MRLLINLLVLIILCGNVEAQNNYAQSNPIVDTLHAIVDNKNNTFFQYHSKSTQISPDLAQQFRVRRSDMLLMPTKASTDTLREGHIVLIPFDPNNLLKTKSSTSDCIAVTYTVRPKETVFKIARRYFDLKTEELRVLNGLVSNDISIDQQLIVGWYVLHPVTESVHITEVPIVSRAPVDPFYPEKPQMQNGVAYWKKSHVDSSHMFAMHRSARINSLIEITNPMFETTVLVKVVGRIPPTYNQDISLVVSPAVAKKLGVLDPRFRAEMRFVK